MRNDERQKGKRSAFEIRHQSPSAHSPFFSFSTSIMLGKFTTLLIGAKSCEASNTVSQKAASPASSG